MRRISLILFTLLLSSGLHSQNTDKVINFFGTGRTWIENDHVSGSLVANDTTNPARANSGYALIDLGINIVPSSNIQINSIIRARNEFGGFYGAGASVTIRELYARGIVADKLNYKIGDLDLKQSKYTLWNYEEEGKVNESSVFAIPRSIIHYENFYTDKNTWRMQGFHSDISFQLGKAIDKLSVEGFMTRIRQAGFTIPAGNNPEKLMGGASINIMQSKFFSLTGNYTNLFEVASTGSANTGMQDEVGTLKGEITLPVNEDLKIGVYTEAGYSHLKYKNQPAAPGARTGNVFDGGVSIQSKLVYANVSYRYVTNNFFSAGAQTKRINYAIDPFIFPFLGNASFDRPLTLLDLSRDPRVYNRTISEVWMNYRPAYANTLPYGDATPNRKGLTGELSLKDKDDKVKLSLASALLTDITGQGTVKNKNYFLTTAGVDLYLHKLLNWKKQLKINAGWKIDNSSRSGDSIESVDYNTNLIEAGLDWEVVNKLELLAGVKSISARGNEYLPLRDAFNTIVDYARVNDDLTETIIAAGFKYQFSDQIYLSVQNHYSIIQQKTVRYIYNINQLFILFNIKF